MSEQSINRRVLALALPAFAALVAQPLFLLADTAIVARLGTEPLAGLGAGATVTSTLVGLMVFLAYGSTAMVARQLGAGNRTRALELGVQAMWLAVALGVLTHVAGDLITKQGVPLPVLWLLKRKRVALTPMRTGTTLEKAVLAPAFLLVAVWFLYSNTAARDVVDPYLQGLLSLG